MPTTPRNRVEQSGTVTHDHLTSWVTDGVIKDSGISAIIGTTAENLFDTAVLAAAATIPGSTTWLRTAGLVTVGDHGDALYAKVLGSTPGGFQSADGAWWQPITGSSSGGGGGFNTRAEAAVTTIANSVETIQIEGFSVAGDGGGAVYKRAAVQPAHSFWFQSADGAYWVPFTNDLRLSVRINGAVLDGATDDVTEIQEVIDACIYYLLALEAFIPIGTTVISKTLHVGYGSSGFTAGRLRGAGFNEYANGPGTLIDARSFFNAPVINIQGGRNTRVSDFGLIGANKTYVSDFSLGGQADTVVDDTDVNNWVDPALLASNPNIVGAYTSYCAISVDAYSGGAPTPHYPNVTYPPFVSGSQYSKTDTSRTELEDLMLDGFILAIANGDNTAQQQSEFTRTRRSYITRCVYGLSIGHQNCRNQLLQDVGFLSCHTLIDNATFGAGKGHLSNQIVNCDGNLSIRLVNLKTSFGPILFDTFYCENCWWIGNIIGGETATFLNCELRFDLHGFFTGYLAGDSNSPQRGIPEFLIDASDAQAGIQFIGGKIFNHWSVCVINTSPDMVEFRNVDISPAKKRDYNYDKAAFNATLGGLIFTNLGVPAAGATNLKVVSFADGVGIALNTSYDHDPWGGARGNYTPIYCLHHYPVASSVLDIVECPVRFFEPPGATYTAVLTSDAEAGLILTMTFPAGPDPVFGPLPSDIIKASNTYSIFFVRSVSPDGKTVTAVLQNNIHQTAWGAWVERNPSNINTGTDDHWKVASARFYTPVFGLYGDLTSGNSDIANVTTGTFNPTVSSCVSIGDYLYQDAAIDDTFTGSALITNINDGTRVISMDRNANVTRSRVRLGTFVYPGPTLESAAFDPLVYGALVWLDAQDLTQMYRNRATTPNNTNNLFFHSNELLEFNNVNGRRGWAFDTLTGSFPAQNQTGPSGESNYAWSFVCSGADVADWFQVLPQTSITGQIFTYQAKVKSSSTSCWIAAFSTASGNDPVFVDCKNGVIGHTPAGITATITASTGGFFLLKLTAVGMGTFFAIVAGDNNYAAPGAGTTLVLCDQMIELGSTASTYSADANATSYSLYTTAAVNAPVGAMVNKGILGGVWIAPTDAQRPFLRSVTIGPDTRHYLDFSVNSGDAYLSAPSGVTLTSTALSCAAVRRPAAGANTVVFGASATATPHTVRWATSNHLITALGDTAFDDGVAHVATGNNLLTDRRTAGNLQFTRLNKLATGNGAANAALTNKIDRLGVHNGTNSVGGFFAGAIFGADLAANVSTIEDYFGAIIGI